MLKLKVCSLLLAIISTAMAATAHADLIPTGDDTFYYRMGGGEAVSVPANAGEKSMSLNVNADIGLGYNCGVFDPKASITNSLNSIKSSFQNIEQNVLDNATAAVAELPMYLLARADPDLYNLLNNGLLGARKDLEVSTKTCEAMQGEIAQGKNPYSEWASASIGNDWKYHMSLAGDKSTKLSATSTSKDNDINQVRDQVQKDNGEKGIPWVHGANIGRRGAYAGGLNQPTILVLTDTAIAGYNVILSERRAYDDTHAPNRTIANAHLVDTWQTPTAAARWVTTLLGDNKITTYQGGDKQSTPGRGLLPDHQQMTAQLTQQLQRLISGQTTASIETLQAVSAPGVMINTAVINAIRQHAPVTQSIIINKLAQEVATARLIDKALLARQILQEGGRVPAIYASKAAQTEIKNALTRLDEDINNLLFNVRVRKELVSETVSLLLNNTQSQQLQNAAVQPNGAPASLLENGAIRKQAGQ